MSGERPAHERGMRRDIMMGRVMVFSEGARLGLARADASNFAP